MESLSFVRVQLDVVTCQENLQMKMNKRGRERGEEERRRGGEGRGGEGREGKESE